MPVYTCENCKTSMPETDTNCRVCGYPQLGSKREKIAYNTKLMRAKDLLEDSEKSIKGVLSMGIIFFFMSGIVLVFSWIFNENHYLNALILALAGVVYFILNRLGKRSAYLMAALALLFYLAHTIFEFSNGMYLKSPVDLNESFIESKGTSIIFALIPLAYMIFRLALMIVFARFFLIGIKLKALGYLF